MARKGTFKMQDVVRYFQAPPFDWATRCDADDPRGILRAARWTFIVLSCGHIKRDPWEAYGNELAKRVQATLHHSFNWAEGRRVRCTECISGQTQYGVPKIIPPIEEHLPPEQVSQQFRAKL